MIEAYASLLVRLTVLLGGSHQPKEQVIQALKGILQFEVDVIKVKGTKLKNELKMARKINQAIDEPVDAVPFEPELLLLLQSATCYYNVRHYRGRSLHYGGWHATRTLKPLTI